MTLHQTCSTLPNHTMYAISFIKFLKPPFSSFENVSISTKMIFYWVSYNRIAFSLMIHSETLLPPNSFSYIQISSNISTFSIICDVCLVRTVTPLQHQFPWFVSLFLRIVQIVDFNKLKWVARSETRIPFSCLTMISFFTFRDSSNFSFHFAGIITLLWSHGGLFNNLL